jgi:hypothetical protein
MDGEDTGEWSSRSQAYLMETGGWTDGQTDALFLHHANRKMNDHSELQIWNKEKAGGM